MCINQIYSREICINLLLISLSYFIIIFIYFVNTLYWGNGLNGVRYNSEYIRINNFKYPQIYKEFHKFDL